MKYYLRLLSTLIIVALVSVSPSLAKDDNYLKEMEEFENYKKDVNLEFQKYINIVNEEFGKFKKEVYKEWGDYLISDKKKWVEYSSDFKLRKIVDFENNLIAIQVKANNPSEEKELIRKEIRNILTEDIKTATSKDKLTQNVVKKLSGLQDVQTGTQPGNNTKVIGDLVSKREDTNRVADSLIKNGEFRTVKDKKGGEITTFQVQLNISDREKALKFKKYVDTYAQIYNISPELIYAIIHTESYFNPMATSPAPAYGLMQIMPTNAGKDAAKVLYGTPILFLPTFLYDPDNNINVGTVYFNLLRNNYLNGIKNERSREYIAIVGYNIGLRNVLMLFSIDGNIKNATIKINQLSDEEVCATIIKKLPHKGGVDYLLKIKDRMELYKNL